MLGDAIKQTQRTSNTQVTERERKRTAGKGLGVTDAPFCKQRRYQSAFKNSNKQIPQYLKTPEPNAGVGRGINLGGRGEGVAVKLRTGRDRGGGGRGEGVRVQSMGSPAVAEGSTRSPMSPRISLPSPVSTFVKSLCCFSSN